ncbi:MAG: DNA repair protein [Clostridia bacterium]|nr:DNA repair protein [Clostridia bacterium]
MFTKRKKGDKAVEQVQKVYFCIDMKSFFASVECAERGLNPFEANLVVADGSRGDGAICLAVSPKLKSIGVSNRCRLFEIPKHLDVIIAKPRMRKYIEYAADIYEIYLKYLSPDSIHVYSIDECFIDATDYVHVHEVSPKDFAKKLMDEIAVKTGIPATAGIGTNLFLAKVALDITAKKVPDHIGYLDEETFKKTLWHHTPITDIWGISRGTEKRLAKMYITDLYGITLCSEKRLYKEFGINAELLIDHAWGRETCTIQDIKNYKSKSRSLSNSQIFFHDYDFAGARLALTEMALTLCQSLISERLIAGGVFVGIGYSKDVIPSTGGSMKMPRATSLFSYIKEYVLKLFDKFADKNTPIRKVSIGYYNLADESSEGYDLFTDIDSAKKEKRLEQTVIGIKQKFGKNAMLRGMDLQEGATARDRNKLIGGHNGE